MPEAKLRGRHAARRIVARRVRPIALASLVFALRLMGRRRFSTRRTRIGLVHLRFAKASPTVHFALHARISVLLKRVIEQNSPIAARETMRSGGPAPRRMVNLLARPTETGLDYLIELEKHRSRRLTGPVNDPSSVVGRMIHRPQQVTAAGVPARPISLRHHSREPRKIPAPRLTSPVAETLQDHPGFDPPLHRDSAPGMPPGKLRGLPVTRRKKYSMSAADVTSASMRHSVELKAELEKIGRSGSGLHGRDNGLQTHASKRLHMPTLNRSSGAEDDERDPGAAPAIIPSIMARRRFGSRVIPIPGRRFFNPIGRRLGMRAMPAFQGDASSPAPAVDHLPQVRPGGPANHASVAAGRARVGAGRGRTLPRLVIAPFKASSIPEFSGAVSTHARTIEPPPQTRLRRVGADSGLERRGTLSTADPPLVTPQQLRALSQRVYELIADRVRRERERIGR